ncbi:hypothetical protein [Deinococcus roseus]|uniref:hypothetical protein n=1 Tax=Deinococcus roseus TaxID=392414 RepID=UPI00166A2449|nr:hypothetical protein [Deinococcus roseus]
MKFLFLLVLGVELVACSPPSDVTGKWRCYDCSNQVELDLKPEGILLVNVDQKIQQTRWSFENHFLHFEFASVGVPLKVQFASSPPDAFNTNLGVTVDVRFPDLKPYFCLWIDDYFCFERM